MILSPINTGELPAPYSSWNGPRGCSQIFLAPQAVANQSVTAEKNKHTPAIARGSGRRRAADRMRLFDVRRADGLSPERLAGLPIQRFGGQLFRPGAVGGQKYFVAAQDRGGMSRIHRHSPHRSGRLIEARGQRACRQTGQTFVGTKIFRVWRPAGGCGNGRGGAQTSEHEIVQMARHGRLGFWYGGITRRLAWPNTEESRAQSRAAFAFISSGAQPASTLQQQT